MKKHPDMPLVHGLTRCDTVKKARQWLDENGVGHRFHDFRTEGLDPAQLDAWIDSLGAEALLNRRGTTWRQLSEDERAGAVDREAIRALLLARPSLIRRPVVAWPSGHFTVGFDEASYQEAAGR